MEQIVKPLNKDHDFGPSYMMLIGVSLLLDGSHLKNIIIKDARVVYHGGPLRLENVYFLNCTFDLQREPSTLNFAKAVLEAGPATNFTTA